MNNLAQQWAALEAGNSVIVHARDVITAVGPDTAKFLHGQMSQHMEGLAIGAVSWSLHLQPNGRLIGMSRVVRLDEETFRLDTEAGIGQGIHDALKRFLIRTKCTLTIDLAVPATRHVSLDAVALPGSVSCAPWPGFDVFGTETDGPDAHVAVDVVDDAVAEAWRISHGEPSQLLDFSENTLPSDTGVIPYAVTFGKGCYVGQELVERIDSRGRILKALVRLVGSGLSAGAEVLNSVGATVGTVTSCAEAPNGSVGLGVVRADAGDVVQVNGQAVQVLRPLVVEPN
jgi:tRNA-modifying protein YgfZ